MAEKDSAVGELTARIAELENQSAAVAEQLEQARCAEREAAAAATEAGTRAAAVEARAGAFQEAHDALLQRITPETPRRHQAEGETDA